jgi:hypothetical protein
MPHHGIGLFDSRGPAECFASNHLIAKNGQRFIPVCAVRYVSVADWQVTCFLANEDHIFNGPGVNFINVLCTNFSYKRRFDSFFYVHVTREIRTCN